MTFRLFTVLAVVALAVSTWILSSPGRRPQSAAGAGQAELPGYFLKNTVLTDFDAAGDPTIRLESERIDQIDHSSEVSLSTVHIDYQTPNGQDWVLVGDTGRIQPGGKVIDVMGNVRLQGDSTEHPGTVIVHTEALSYDVPESIVTSAEDVRVEFGAHTLSAHGLKANLKERTLHLDSKVNGRFQH
jgi:LPS export ABC transporter protein LptC